MEVIKKILSSKIFLFFLLLAVIWVGLVSIKAYYKKSQLDQEVTSLKSEIGKLDQQDQDLSQLIKYFNNQNYLEKEAKDKLNLKKSDENVVMVPEGQLNEEADASQELSSTKTNGILNNSQSARDAENNLVKWWKYLFGR
jgi:cell division protein FtsB